MKIGTKIVGGFAAVALMTGIVGGIAGMALRNTSGSIHAVLHTYVPIVDAAMRARIHLLTVGDRLSDMLLAEGGPDGALHHETAAEAMEHIAAYNKQMDELKKIRPSGLAGLARTLPDLDEQTAFFERNAALLVSAVRQGNKVEGKKAVDDLDAAEKNILTAMATVEKNARQAMEEAVMRTDSATAVSQWVIWLFTFIAVLTAFLIGCIMARRIGVPLAKTAHMIDEMENGHLGMRLNMKRGDELGRMARALDSFATILETIFLAALQKISNGDLTYDPDVRDEQDEIGNALAKVQHDLNELVGQMRTTAREVAEAAGQVADTSQALSQGATESASSLEEVASVMNEIASQTKHNADNASQADRLAREVKDAAEMGNQEMGALGDAMREISASSQNISKIIKVIDEIAFQTNLLALNAAVEAARAGQHGKGFAVVAEEVRNLAARSAKAARETSGLIEGSVQKTERGMSIASNTAKALERIVDGVNRVSALVSEIAVASDEQAKGIDEVTQGVAQIDRVTQQNTASAEQSASASEELAAQADQLLGMLERFRLLDEGGNGAGRQLALPDPAMAFVPRSSSKRLPSITLD